MTTTTITTVMASTATRARALSCLNNLLNLMILITSVVRPELWWSSVCHLAIDDDAPLYDGTHSISIQQIFFLLQLKLLNTDHCRQSFRCYVTFSIHPFRNSVVYFTYYFWFYYHIGGGRGGVLESFFYSLSVAPYPVRVPLLDNSDMYVDENTHTQICCGVNCNNQR